MVIRGSNWEYFLFDFEPLNGILENKLCIKCKEISFIFWTWAVKTFLFNICLRPGKSPLSLDRGGHAQ